MHPHLEVVPQAGVEGTVLRLVRAPGLDARRHVERKRELRLARRDCDREPSGGFTQGLAGAAHVQPAAVGGDAQADGHGPERPHLDGDSVANGIAASDLYVDALDEVLAVCEEVKVAAVGGDLLKSDVGIIAEAARVVGYAAEVVQHVHLEQTLQMALAVAAHVVRAPPPVAEHPRHERVEERTLPVVEIAGLARSLVEEPAQAHPVHDVARLADGVGVGARACEVVVEPYGAHSVQLVRGKLVEYALRGLERTLLAVRGGILHKALQHAHELVCLGPVQGVVVPCVQRLVGERVCD